MLKSKSTHFTAVLLVMLTAMTGALAGAADGPKVVVPETVKDMGTVAQGEEIYVEFELVNEGDETLILKAVRPTCGCDFSGPISKSILIMTNDPQTPTLTVVIKTEVHPYVEILPRALVRFNAVQHEPMNQKVIVVAGDDDKDFEVTGIKSSVPFLKATVRPLGADELLAGKSSNQFEVALSMDAGAPVGPVNAVLEVETNHPKAKTVPVKVFGVVRALLHVTPSQIQFGSVEAKKRPGRNIILVNNRTGGVKVAVNGATVDDAAFTAEVVTIDEGKRYQVTVTIKSDASPGPRDAVLTLKTSDSEFPELKVPVRANIT
jgi:hypothetical protein